MAADRKFLCQQFACTQFFGGTETLDICPENLEKLSKKNFGSGNTASLVVFLKIIALINCN